MNKSEAINELAAALAKAQAKIEGAIKDRTNPAFRSQYADLGAVWDAIRGPLTENGLSIAQFPRAVQNGVEVETLLMHASGQFVSDVFWVPCAKADAHGYMAAATYARRGALSAIAGVAPVDDDGNEASGAAVGSAPTSRATARAAPSRAVMPLPPPSPSPPAVAKVPPHKPGNLDTDTRTSASAAFVDQSIGAMKALPSQEAVRAWWDSRAKQIDALEVRYPDEHIRLKDAYDEIYLDKPSVTAAG